MGRYFVGIEVPKETCGAKLMEVQQRLQPTLHVKRWYSREQFHLTTHFLGELDEAGVAKVIERVALHAERQTPFSLRLEGAGWFPQAKVVWCGLAGDLGPLRTLHAALAESLKAVGADRFAHDQFRPHITLGRLRTVDPSWQPPDISDLLSGAEWDVTALHLFESVSTGGGGPQYPIRHTFLFR
jgi:2'-5' RNA ligase